MLREYTNSEKEYREVWINYNLKALGSKKEKDRVKLAEIFDSKFERGVLEIENTQSADTHLIPADKFFMKAGDRFILNESGTLTDRHKFKIGEIVPIIQNSIKIRQIKKKAKIKAAEMNDNINHGILSNEEYTLKIIINGFFGLFLYAKSIFFNPSIGASITAAGRNVISTSAITVELIGEGYRSYLVEAHLQLINIAREEADTLSSKYTLPKVTVEDTLKQLLLYHYEGYYALSFLRSVLEGLSDNELSTVYLKNNFKAFIKIPEVRDVITKIYNENNTWRESLEEHDAKTEKEILKVFSRLEPKEQGKVCKAYVCSYAKHPIFGPLSRKLKEMSGELLMGFYFYSGDYIDGHYRETTVDMFEFMERVKIPTADTDSNVTTVYDECEILNEAFSGYVEEDEYVKEVTTTVIATMIYVGAIDLSLDRYTKAVGVSSDYSHMIDMEEEFFMSDLHLTTGKKKYVFSYFILDGNFNSKVYDTVKIKGLQSIKSDYNRDICDKVNDIFNRKVMAKMDELDYVGVIKEAKDLTDDIESMIRSDDYILHHSTIKKSNKSSEELAFGDSKNKMSRLWKRFGLDGEVDFPGSYKELEVKFSYSILESIEEQYPEIYSGLIEHVKEIKMFEFYRSVINGAKKFMDGKGGHTETSLRVIDNGYADTIMKVAGNVIRLNAEQLDESLAKRMSFDLFKSEFDTSFINVVRKCFGMSPGIVIRWDSELKDVIIDVSNDDIIENINKIALPLDINTVPGFLKIDNYALLDADFAATGEFLLGGLVDTMGISCPRNKTDKMMISSALQTY